MYCMNTFLLRGLKNSKMENIPGFLTTFPINLQSLPVSLVYFFGFSSIFLWNCVFEYVHTHIHMYIHICLHTHILTYTCASYLLTKRLEYNPAMPLFGDIFSSHLQCPGTLSTYRFISFFYNAFIIFYRISSIQFSPSVVSYSLWPHELQHARPPCPSPTPGVYLNSCPLSRWCHPIISSSVFPFSSCLQSLPASGSFQMSQLFTSGGQSIRVSASASVLPMNTQDWSPLGWTGWISLQSKGPSRVFSNTTVQKHQFFGAQLSSQSNSHIHTWPMEKP